MANRERNVGINIRVTPNEKKKISRYAKKCRLTLSEYIRKVAVRDEPKVFIPKEIEDSLLRIRTVIEDIERDCRTDSDPVSVLLSERYERDLYKILVETLQLMRGIGTKSEAESHGNN